MHYSAEQITLMDERSKERDLFDIDKEIEEVKTAFSPFKKGHKAKGYILFVGYGKEDEENISKAKIVCKNLNPNELSVAVLEMMKSDPYVENLVREDIIMSILTKGEGKHD